MDYLSLSIYIDMNVYKRFGVFARRCNQPQYPKQFQPKSPKQFQPKPPKQFQPKSPTQFQLHTC